MKIRLRTVLLFGPMAICLAIFPVLLDAAEPPGEHKHEPAASEKESGKCCCKAMMTAAKQSPKPAAAASDQESDKCCCKAMMTVGKQSPKPATASTHAHADSADQRSEDGAKLGEIPARLRDPGFDRMVDLKLFGKAMNALDAAMLTDAALEMVEGERLLMRPHRALTGKEALRLALGLAVDTRDKRALDRLARHAQRSGDQAFEKEVAAAVKKFAEAPAPEPIFPVDPTSCSSQQFEFIRDAVRDLKVARLTRSIKAVAHVIERTDGAGEEFLSAEQKTALLRVLKKTHTELTAAKLSEQEMKLAETIAELQKIANASTAR